MDRTQSYPGDRSRRAAPQLIGTSRCDRCLRRNASAGSQYVVVLASVALCNLLIDYTNPPIFKTLGTCLPDAEIALDSFAKLFNIYFTFIHAFYSQEVHSAAL